MRPVRFIGPRESAAELLRAFVDEHAHLAVVRTAQGKTLGLVTLEDLVEQLVGELEDEFDRLPRMIHALTGQLWMIGGGVPVSEVNRKLDLALPSASLPLSRWLLERLSGPPHPGDVVREQDVTFTIRRVRRGNIFEASVQA
jgi:putative hemolysin